MTDIDLTPADAPARSPKFVLLAVAAAVIAVLGVIVAVATGGDDDAAVDDPIELLSAAPDAVREAGTARIAMAMEMGGEGISMDFGGSGVVDFVSGNSSFEMSMMGTSFEMRMIDETMYMRLPDMGQETGPTTAWVAMPAPTGMAQSTFSGPTSMTGFLEAMRGVSGAIEELGDEEVNGVQARGFRVEVDVRKAIESLPDDQRGELEADLESIEAMGMTTFPMEIWISDDAIPVRMIMDMKTDMFDMKMTMDLTDFGVAVDIQPPAESDVTRVSDEAELQQIMTATVDQAA